MPTLKIVVPDSPFLTDPRAFMPLGPIQIATAARDIAGWNVEIVDLNGQSGRPTTWLETSADVWGIFAKTCHVADVREIVRVIREQWSSAYVVGGGPHANTRPNDMLELGCDCAVVSQSGGGGGESGLLFILERAATGTRAVGIVSRPPGDPSMYPWPDRSFVDVASYNYYIGNERAAHVVTQYGCCRACAHCSHWSGYRKISYRSKQHVTDELKELKFLGFGAVMNFSDELTTSKTHCQEWCEAVRSVGLLWRAFVHTGYLTEGDITMMAEAGCVSLGAGVESGSADILTSIKKGTTPESNLRWVEWCVKHKIAPKAFLIVGLPGESLETVEATRCWLRLAVDAGLADFDMTPYAPLPGSPIGDCPSGWGLTLAPEAAATPMFYKGATGTVRAWADTKYMDVAALEAAREALESEFRPLVASRVRSGDSIQSGMTR